MNIENKPIRTKTTEMKIGKITYIVTTHYNEAGRETAEQKFLRIISERVAKDIKNTESTVI